MSYKPLLLYLWQSAVEGYFNFDRKKEARVMSFQLYVQQLDGSHVYPGPKQYVRQCARTLAACIRLCICTYTHLVSEMSIITRSLMT